ncbi:phospholipid carrier-dependent glycosyltransferase [soil metagenome]
MPATRSVKRVSGPRSTRPTAAALAVPAPVELGRAALTLFAFACAFLALQIPVARAQSATWDEPGHLAAGYAMLTAGDYRLDIEHPPLLRMWTALPLLLKTDVHADFPTIDPARPEAIAFSGPFEAGHTFLYKRNDADGVLFAARCMVIGLGLLLGALVYWWVTEWRGQRAATIALALFLAEPNLAAHAGLATTDFGVATFIFGTVFFLWRATRRWTAWNLAAVTGFFVLAVFTKFSALLLGPIILVLLLIVSRSERDLTARRIATLIGILFLAAWAAAWLFYGMRYEPSRDAGSVLALHAQRTVIQAVPAWASVVSFIDQLRLLPNALSEGFLHGQSLAVARPAFFAGDHSMDGWWYYFPAAILLKTPIILLLLFAVGAAVAVRGRRVPRPGSMFLVVPIVMFLVIAMTTNLNIGLRHLLPVYPLMIVLAGLGAEALSARFRRQQIAVALIVSVAALEFGLVYPHNLSFFNVFAGGPANGFRYLADSNVDWGQDLKRLKRWMEERQVAHINLAYFGTAEPSYHGITRTDLWGTTIPGVAPSAMGPPHLPGYVAVSVTLLDGVPFGERERQFYAPLREREPAAKIGGSIRVYWVEKPWWTVPNR